MVVALEVALVVVLVVEPVAVGPVAALA